MHQERSGNLSPDGEQVAAGPNETRFGLRSTDHLQQDLAQHWIFPLAVEILEQPGWSFDRLYRRLAEASLGLFWKWAGSTAGP